jgi:plasmid stabilization system protein ParE
MKLRIQPAATNDLRVAFEYYEEQSPGLGSHFVKCLIGDLERLKQFAGIHARESGFQRLKSQRFPFVVFYEVFEEEIVVFAVLDWRRDPQWIEDQLGER